MNGITHKQAMKWIDRRQDGLLKNDQQLLLDEHLRSCDSCHIYSEEMEFLASRLSHEFQGRWEDDPGPSKNVVANVTTRAKIIPAARRFSSGLSLLGGLTALVLLGIVINFFVSQLRDSSPVASGTEAISSFPLPENRLLAFALNENGNSEIYTMHADGSGLTNLTNDPAYDGFPHWSPDGKQIAFESDRDGSNQIFLMDADGSNVTQLTQGGDWNGFLGGSINTPWSPDGRKLIFSQNTIDDEKHQFYVMDVATKNIVLLTKEAGEYFSPSWSPDGEHIAFTSDETQGNQPIFFQLYIVDSQGTQLTNLTEGLPEHESLSLADYYWSPDGTFITFVTEAQRGTYKSTIYNASLDGSRVELAQTNQQILDWWNDIVLQTDVPQKVEQTSWSLRRADGSQYSLQTCQSNDLPVAYALKRSADGTLAFGAKCSPNGWMLYGANPDGTAVHELLTSPLDARYDSLFQMTWSPDDHFFAFATYDEEQFEVTNLFILNAKDPSIQPLKMENSSAPSWQPVP